MVFIAEPGPEMQIIRGQADQVQHNPGRRSGRHGLPRLNRQCWGSAKNKKPAVLPPPVVVGTKQHNMDIGTWDGAKQNGMLPPREFQAGSKEMDTGQHLNVIVQRHCVYTSDLN